MDRLTTLVCLVVSNDSLGPSSSLVPLPYVGWDVDDIRKAGLWQSLGSVGSL